VKDQASQHIYRKSKRDMIAVTRERWNWYSRVMIAGINLAARSLHIPVLGPLLKKLVFMDQPDKKFTQSYTFNLNHNLDEADKNQNVVLPIDLIRKAIEDSEFRAIMDKCLCRSGNKCKNFDSGLGCIFLGRGAVSTVRNGIAREATVEDALAHLEKAANLGLAGMSMWIELENYVWGIKEEDRHRWLEICFCCTCCCLALSNIKKMPPDIQQRFKAMGWKATCTSGCNGCGICETSCPMGAISLIDNSVSISDICLGCGICSFKCPEEAIEMKMISTLKDKLQEYYRGFDLQV